MTVLRRFLPAFAAALFALLVAVPALAQDSGSSEWFQAERLNPGLAPASETIDRETPRSSLESFLDAARLGDWDTAAHMLDLSLIPQDEQAEQGRQRARDFWHLVQRKIVIDWYDIPDRPDGLEARAGSNEPMAGQPRRSILLWYVEGDGRPVPIRINRIKPQGGDAVWLISKQSVEHLAQLGAEYGPTRFESMLPDLLRRDAFWGLFWWEVIALPLGLILTGLAGVLTHKLMSKGENRNRRIAPESLLVATRGPVILLVMTLVLHALSTWVFIFSGRIGTVISPLIVVGVVVAVLWLVVNAADAILTRLVSFDGAELSAVGEGQEQRRSMATKISAIRRFMLVIIAVVGAGVVLNEASVMQSLGISLLASAGTLTLLVAFAGRNILSNIMSSLQISLNQSARIGDKISFRGNVCSVERIHFTYVQLRIWTGKRLVVPVSEFVSEPFENWTMGDHENVFEVILRLSHRADIEPLRKKYTELMDDEGMPDNGNRGVLVSDHDVWGQTVLFLVPTTDPNTGWAFSCEMREALLAEARRIDCEVTPIFPDAPVMDEGAPEGSQRG